MTAAWQLPPLRVSTRETPAELISRRNRAAGAPTQEPDPDIITRSDIFGGVSCVVCEPRSPKSTSVYFHGGGYRLGSAAGFAPFARELARSTSSIVVAVDYRLAPEHPFPACLHDAVAVYGALLEAGEHPVAIGDSAGGGIAAALVVAAAISGVPSPAGLVLMSPWLDLTCTADTFVSRAGSDQLFSSDSAQEAAEWYLQGHEAADPLASPLFANLEAWPPTLIMASTDEVLLADGLRFASALALAGTRVTAMFEPARAHIWPVFTQLPESASALTAIGAFYAGLGRRH